MASDWMDEHDETVDELNAAKQEIERLRLLLGRSDPVRCKSCDRIRERAEVICGHCTYRLDGSDLEEGTA